MTLLYAHPRFLDHDTGAHPESPERLRHVTQMLDSSGLAERCVRPVWEGAAESRLLAVHDASYDKEPHSWYGKTLIWLSGTD